MVSGNVSRRTLRRSIHPALAITSLDDGPVMFTQHTNEEHFHQNFQKLTTEVEETDANFQDSDSINILLLGQTGVGKTTMINALRNYLEYPTLKDAINGGVNVLIPSKFTQGDTTVLVGEEDLGEASTGADFAGKSSTQSCRSHYFITSDNRNIRMIDTPGIGDVRGLTQDKKNTDHILQYLSSVDHLHGICILLKPNESRLTPEFKFCLTSLLTNLHKHAANNIMFCYTNTRATLYSYGDTNGIIKEMLKEIRNVHGQEIPYNKQNTFFFDSESFRLLACIENGLKFPERTIDAFSGSWDNSVVETVRLLDTILGIKPHVVAETVSLNEARKLITLLSRPMTEIADSITSNIAKIKQQRKKISQTKNEEDQLQACLWRHRESLEMSPLDYPRTVCTASRCISVVDNATEYSSICHDHCYLDNVPHDTIGDPALVGCACINNQTGRCTVGNCRCDWRLHQHITYTTRRVQKKVRDESVQKQIEQNISTKEIVESTLEQLKNDTQELEDEKNKIRTASARFAVFLKENAITPFNDSVDKYLENMIEQRRNLNEMDIVDGLEKLRREYQEEKGLYEKSLAASSSSGYASIKPNDVMSVVAELEKLRRSGASLKKQMQLSKQCMSDFEPYRRSSTYCRPKLTKDPTWIRKQSEGLKGFNQPFRPFASLFSGLQSASAKIIGIHASQSSEEKNDKGVMVPVIVPYSPTQNQLVSSLRRYPSATY